MSLVAVRTVGLKLTARIRMTLGSTSGTNLLPATSSLRMAKFLAFETSKWIQDIRTHSNIYIPSFDTGWKNSRRKCQNNVFGWNSGSSLSRKDSPNINNSLRRKTFKNFVV
ncbi:hypothetical protein AVEN_221078-1 [Araneus ventricosus]|uniref:Uncharacterized protein n=1 Tax=Araneus ventricosus TaxID=182803 RepID=A0A4Y2VJ76_ARAVE|nr:hypothetical protein AVEN_221078-1 [Araneus ventricosus]